MVNHHWRYMVEKFLMEPSGLEPLTLPQPLHAVVINISLELLRINLPEYNFKSPNSSLLIESKLLRIIPTSSGSAERIPM